jgi:hypothetical protein
MAPDPSPNMSEEKAEQEVKAARKRHEGREAAKTQSREAESYESSMADMLDSFNGTGQNSRDGSAGEESPLRMIHKSD